MKGGVEDGLLLAALLSYCELNYLIEIVYRAPKARTREGNKGIRGLSFKYVKIVDLQN